MEKAFLPINLMKREIYWNHPYPMGIADVDLEEVIDIDESGYYLETTNKKYGKVLRGRRCSQAGHYNRGRKLNVLLNDLITISRVSAHQI